MGKGKALYIFETDGSLKMNRIDSILNNSAFMDYMSNINRSERDRIYCLHDINHSLDVARICYIINLEEQLGFDKELVYAMALLHDIGRAKEYETGESHHQAGIEIAKDILADCGFDADEIKAICHAIGKHKSAEDSDKRGLGFLLFRADKLSRNCFDCKAYEQCYWMDELKNKGIVV